VNTRPPAESPAVASGRRDAAPRRSSERMSTAAVMRRKKLSIARITPTSTAMEMSAKTHSTRVTNMIVTSERGARELCEPRGPPGSC